MTECPYRIVLFLSHPGFFVLLIACPGTLSAGDSAWHELNMNRTMDS